MSTPETYKPKKGDYCDMCGRLMTLIDSEQDAEEIVLIQGEVRCCCGNYDSDGHYTHARCSDCCGPHFDPYRNSGAGYYITSPR